MTECTACSLGRFAASSHSVECSKCQDGSFTGIAGSSQCTACPDATSTLGHGAVYAHECACPPNKYRKLSGKCADCPIGFTCPQGSDESVLRSFGQPGFQGPTGEYPHLLPGYWASRADPLSVHTCRLVDDCPGGPPQSCAPHMTDIACGLCENGYFKQGEICEPCTNTDEEEFNYPTIAAIAGPIIVIILYNIMQDSVEKWDHWTNELWCFLYLIFVHYQIVGLAVGSNVPWPSRIKGTLYAWEYFVDFPDMLRLSCVGDGQYRFFKESYLIRWTVPLFMLACFLLVYIIGLLIAELGLAVRKAKGRWLDGLFRAMRMKRFTGKVRPVFAVDPSVLFNCYMAVIFGFYISLSFVTLQPFMCYENPNGKSFLRFAPNVECDSKEWEGMLTEAIMGLLVYIAFLIAGLIAVTIAAPKMFHNPVFRARFKFLFIKFRPDVWWWGVVLLLRALLLTLAQTLSQEGERHLIWYMSVILIYSGMLVFLRPWRGKWSHVLDVEIQASLFLFLAMGGTFVARSSWLDDSVAHFAIFITFIPLVAMFLTGAWIVLCNVPIMKERFEEEPNKLLSDDVQEAFAKFVGLDKKAALAFVRKLSGRDRRVLLRAWFIVAAEVTVVGRRPSWVRQSPHFVVRPPVEPKEEHVEVFQDHTDDIDVNDKDGYVPKWKMNPPNRRSPKPASQAGPRDAAAMSDTAKSRDNTARTNTTAAGSQAPSTSQSTGHMNIGSHQDITAESPT